jgi:hypothetical protein
MIKIKSIYALFIISILTSCGTSLKVPIDKNKLNSDVTIEFVNKKITIKSGETFSLSEQDFKANSLPIDQWINKFMDINYTLKKFKKGKFKNYDILITNPDYKKKYYGKIAFFNTNKVSEMAVVAKFRSITIDDDYFDRATEGRTAMMYEYSEANYNALVPRSQGRVPTWILLMSDEPF